ncbi:MAG: IS5 family transposase [Betaproteobacteria bacterium]|nr:IS5 family transposase [Betaproteobacteria bacterium]
MFYTGTMQKRPLRDWRGYNQKLKHQGKIELYVSSEIWEPYAGERRPGGVIRYNDALIKACLLVRIYFSLGLRQTQGFMESLLRALGIYGTAPDYTTLCRRSKTIDVSLQAKIQQPRAVGCVLAIDSTGLSLLSSDSWNRHKHKHHAQKRGNHSWHKLHLIIDTETGDVLVCTDTPANVHDCKVLPQLLEALPKDMQIEAVCADMAYDTLKCRTAIHERQACQRIPPKADAVLSTERKKIGSEDERQVLKERDDAIGYMRANSINGCDKLARKQWKTLVGYHRRSLVESTMSRIKAHTGTVLKSRLPATRKTECMLRCTLLNIENHA